MAVVKQKPTTPGRRGMVRVVTPDLYKGRPQSGLVEAKKSISGRNNAGRITVRPVSNTHLTLPPNREE